MAYKTHGKFPMVRFMFLTQNGKKDKLVELPLYMVGNKAIELFNARNEFYNRFCTIYGELTYISKIKQIKAFVHKIEVMDDGTRSA